MKVKSEISIEIEFTLEIGEEEARALDALVSYGTDVFIREFYKHLGEFYLKPHETGLRSFFEGIKSKISPKLKYFNELKK